MILNKIGPQGLLCPHPWQLYFHNIQTSSPLKPLNLANQSQILCEASIGCVINVYINNPGHMTKMATMPIYGKNP